MRLLETFIATNALMHIPSLLLLLLGLISADALACSPQTEVPQRTLDDVKRDFRDSRFVVIASVIDVRNLPRRSSFGVEYEVERATFRVERVFKGSVKPGHTFAIESGASTCALGVLDTQWRPIPPPGKTSVALPSYPRRWLIYFRPWPPEEARFEITGSPLTQPVEWARDDLDMLNRHAHKWNAKPARGKGTH